MVHYYRLNQLLMLRVIFVNGRTFGKPDPVLPTYPDFPGLEYFHSVQ